MRKAPVAGTDKMAFTTVTAQMVNMQPASDSSTLIREGTFGKRFRFFCDGGADVQQGDKLTDSSGNVYVVLADGVSRRTMGSIDYMLVVVEKL